MSILQEIRPDNEYVYDSISWKSRDVWLEDVCDSLAVWSLAELNQTTQTKFIPPNEKNMTAIPFFPSSLFVTATLNQCAKKCQRW